jgi:hypothetical protein
LIEPNAAAESLTSRSLDTYLAAEVPELFLPDGTKMPGKLAPESRTPLHQRHVEALIA